MTRYTLGDVAKHFGVELHKAGYAVQSGQIAPAFRVGGFRIYTDAELPAIEAELSRIAAKHEKGAARDAEPVIA